MISGCFDDRSDSIPCRPEGARIFAPAGAKTIHNNDQVPCCRMLKALCAPVGSNATGDSERRPVMPRIGYDVTSLVGMCTGVGNYTRQLLAHMLNVAGEHDFLLMANRQEAVQDVAP